MPPGWYPSLGPGLSLLNGGWGIGDDGRRRLQVRPDRHERLLPVRHGRRQRDGAVLLHDGVHGHHGHDSHRRDGRALGWKNFCLYGLWVALPYCLYANWVWGGGWLAQAGMNWDLGHGAVDFAGSGVVHAMGGVDRLAGGIVIGPRIGKYVRRQAASRFPATTFRWSSSARSSWRSAGSGLTPARRSSGTDLRISAVVVNTMLASVTGALATMFYLMVTGKKPDPSMMLQRHAGRPGGHHGAMCVRR